MSRLFRLLLPILYILFITQSLSAGNRPEEDALPVEADTTITVDRVQISVIKQGRVLRSEPVAASIVGSRGIERQHVSALKNLRVPNLFIPDYGSRMTSSIYVRGLGARIDQPVVGLNIDNVPVLNKNAFDAELADAERIEVLRGPQSTLYGRNTMGGVINVYTLSPLLYQGTRLMTEYSSGDSYRFRASSYHKFSDRLGVALAGFYTRTGGFHINEYTGRKSDWERMGGGRFKLQWRNNRGLAVDNTLSFSALKQGGYPYAYIGGEEPVASAQVGRIAYNDPCGYRRTTLSEGLTVRYDHPDFTLSSIMSYHYNDDCMILDQDFLPESYFTLQQGLVEHTVTEDLVIRSRNREHYNWLFGAFGFYRHGDMSAPVNFKRTGIEHLIMDHANAGGTGLHYAWDETAAPDWQLPLSSEFELPTWGAAFYHESRVRFGRWHLTLGLRVDSEKTRLRYHSRASLPYLLTTPDGVVHMTRAEIDDSNSISHTYTELLPKVSLMYAFDEMRNLYLTVSRGYKAGGFNTQMFSDILQEKLKWKMVSGIPFKEDDVMSYRPESSWNYEAGGHFSCMDGAVRGDFALFYIDVRDQQLTVFPEGKGTGRMMTNAGKTRSWGVEFSMMALPWDHVELEAAYGFTDARFTRYDNGREDFAGNFLPYSPRHTLSLSGTWTIPTGVDWLGDVVLGISTRSAGRIYWNEQNSRHQPFYTLLDASVRLEHKRYSVDLWGRNLAGSSYDVFYFKSIGNEFVQRGCPRTVGITLNVNINHK